MKERDRGYRLETARLEDEDVEVGGQEEGGKGSSDPSLSSLLKSACVTALMSAWKCVSACVFYALCTLCVVSSFMCVEVCVSFLICNKYYLSSQCCPPPTTVGRETVWLERHVWKCVSVKVSLLWLFCAANWAPWNIVSLAWVGFFFFLTLGLSPGLALSHGLFAKDPLWLIPCISIFMFFHLVILFYIRSQKSMTDSWAIAAPQWWV